MNKINARDRLSLTVVKILFLILMKSAVLKMMIKVFVRELMNEDIQLRVIEDLITSNKLLRNVYFLAETARKIKIKLKKMIDEREKLRKLQFYKSLIQKNMFRTQIETFFTIYDKKSASS